MSNTKIEHELDEPGTFDELPQQQQQESQQQQHDPSSTSPEDRVKASVALVHESSDVNVILATMRASASWPAVQAAACVRLRELLASPSSSTTSTTTLTPNDATNIATLALVALRTHMIVDSAAAPACALFALLTVADDDNDDDDNGDGDAIRTDTASTVAAIAALTNAAGDASVTSKKKKKKNRKNKNKGNAESAGNAGNADNADNAAADADDDNETSPAVAARRVLTATTSDGVAVLIRALRTYPTNADVVLSVCTTLRCLLLLHRDTHAVAALITDTEGSIVALVDALKRHVSNDRIAEKACFVLRRIAASGRVHVASITDAGGIAATTKALMLDVRHKLIAIAATGLLHKLAADSIERQTKANDAGGIAAVVRVLTTHAADVQLTTKACVTLVALIENHPNNITKFAQLGGVAAVASALTKYLANTTVAVPAINLIAHVAVLYVDPNTALTLAQANAASLCMKAIVKHPSHPDVFKYACDALAKMATDEDVAMSVVQQDGISTLLSVVSRYGADPSSLIRVFRAFKTLTVHSRVAPRLASAGGIDHVLKAMKKHVDDDDLMVLSVKLLFNFAATSSPLIVRANGIEHLLNVLTAHAEDILVVEPSLDTLFELAAHSADARSRFLRADGFQIVLKALTEQASFMQQCVPGLELVLGLIAGKPDVAASAVRAGFVELAVRAASKHAGDSQVALLACTLLHTFVVSDRDAKKRAEQAGAVNALQKVIAQTHDNPAIAKSARATLALLGANGSSMATQQQRKQWNETASDDDDDDDLYGAHPMHAEIASVIRKLAKPPPSLDAAMMQLCKLAGYLPLGTFMDMIVKADSMPAIVCAMNRFGADPEFARIGCAVLWRIASYPGAQQRFVDCDGVATIVRALARHISYKPLLAEVNAALLHFTCHDVEVLACLVRDSGVDVVARVMTQHATNDEVCFEWMKVLINIGNNGHRAPVVQAITRACSQVEPGSAAERDLRMAEQAVSIASPIARMHIVQPTPTKKKEYIEGGGAGLIGALKMYRDTLEDIAKSKGSSSSSSSSSSSARR